MNVKIPSSQLVAALLICRFFTMLVATPNSRYTLEGSATLLVPIISGAAIVLLSLPLLVLMKKYPQQSLQGCAERCAPKLKKPLLWWQLLFCLLVAVGSASQSEFFVSTALYPKADRRWVIFFFLLVVWYMVCMGLEAITRVSLIVCGLILLSFGLIFAGVFHLVDWLNLGSPFYESMEKVSMTALAYWGQNVEIVLLCILQPFTRESSFRRDFFSFVGGGLVITEVISFFSAAVLGDYGKTRMFPIYTLASLSGHGFFSRLDYLHIINWTFACLLRCGLFAYGAYILLAELFPKIKKSRLRLLTAGLILGATVGLSYVDNSYQWFYLIFASGVPVLITVVLLPLILLWKSRRKKEVAA